jgi:hypothetical protein
LAFEGFAANGEGASYPNQANGRQSSVPRIRALNLGGQSIHLDGRLDDSAWRDAEAGTGFRVWDPNRGALPTEETIFKVVYDEDAIYFAVACLEKDPAKISSNLSRRDRFSNSDLVSVYIDPYHDRTTGYNFKVNPLGVQIDSYMYGDGERDDDWNAVWQAETSRDDQGWYTELRIPFSSIRYRQAESMTWGLQIYRYMHGRGEDTAWVTWDREISGFISRFGELADIQGVPAPRQLEILPYFLQSSKDPVVTGADDEIDNFQNVGADVKYGISADLTLNATVQPDFGQVEADPAVLNLSPFETFFEEKRPFFIEGSAFFQHPNFNLFYSRRIGTGDENARIRYAAKLTGKTAGDVSVAALLASTDLTGEGQGHNIFKSGGRMTRYLVGRFGKEFDAGKHRFNVMQTAVLNSAGRDELGRYSTSGSYLDRWSREAYTSGIDFDLNFLDRNYQVQGSVVGSIIDPEPVEGDPTTGSKRYGTGGAFNFRKRGGNFNWGLNGRWEHDKLALNDIGFLSAPDEMSSSAYVSYNYNPEGKSKVLNRGEFNVNVWKNWIYAARQGFHDDTGELVWAYGRGHRQGSGGNLNGWMQLKSYREAWWGLELMPEGSQRYETRGGPLIDEPTTVGAWLGTNSDYRKDFKWRLEGSHYRDVEENHSTNLSTGVTWNQSGAVNHDVSLSFENRIDDTQYLETVDLSERPGGRGIGGLSYVFGDIHQKTLDLTIRTNLLFSRNTSIEIYAQPFLSVGDYRRARELITPDSYDLAPYAEPGYNAADNNFSFASANMNTVFRWEYRPGSTFFLVWTHSRSRYDERRGAADPSRFRNSLRPANCFENEPENVFLAKVSYWLPI